jgi:hypothetical protein
MKEIQPSEPQNSVRRGASVPDMQMVNNAASVPKMEKMTGQLGASIPEIPKAPPTPQSNSKEPNEQK